MEKRKQSKAGTSKEAAAHRRALFIEAVVANGGNKTQAAITAGFNPKSAERQGIRLSGDVRVSVEIDRRRSEVLAKAKLSTDDVLISLARAVRFDPRKLYRDDGSLKRVQDLDDDTADALAGLEVVEMAGGMKITVPGAEEGAEPVLQHVPMYTKKLKWSDKNAAREQALKHLGLYEKNNSQLPGVTIVISDIDAKI